MISSLELTFKTCPIRILSSVDGGNCSLISIKKQYAPFRSLNRTEFSSFLIFPNNLSAPFSLVPAFLIVVLPCSHPFLGLTSLLPKTMTSASLASLLRQIRRNFHSRKGEIHSTILSFKIFVWFNSML